MKRVIAVAAATLFASTAALAGHCPKDVKAIDEALAKKPKLTDAQLADVKKQRDAGEAAHKAGKHDEALASLHKAMDTLGIKHADKK